MSAGDWKNDPDARTALAEVHGCSRSTAQRLAKEVRLPATSEHPAEYLDWLDFRGHMR